MTERSQKQSSEHLLIVALAGVSKETMFTVRLDLIWNGTQKRAWSEWWTSVWCLRNAPTAYWTLTPSPKQLCEVKQNDLTQMSNANKMHMLGLIVMHLSEYTHIHTDWTKSLKKLTTQIGDIGCVVGVHGVDAGWLLWNIRDRRLIHGKVGSS